MKLSLRNLLLLALFFASILESLLGSVNEEGNPPICADGSIPNHTCHIEKTSNLLNSFSSVRVKLNCSANCEVLTGHTLQDLKDADSFWQNLLQKLSHLFFSHSPHGKMKKHTLHFSPFVSTYLKVQPAGETMERLKVKFTVDKNVLDTSCLTFLLAGVTLFFSASKLSSSVKFYYTGGIGIGVLASLLIVVFILSRSIPKKPAAYTILFGGWSICAWILRRLLNNWQELLSEYRKYFLAYIGLAGFISFALCYWKGPIKDPRSQHIVQWTIQLFALILLYNSSHSVEVSIAIVLVAACTHLALLAPGSDIRNCVMAVVRKCWWKSKPKPKRFLTEEEYRIQAEIETKRALEEMKQFCNSPECSPWKTMSRIKSPMRFARFMEGEAHVSDAEVTLHDQESIGSDSDANSDLITDDETEDSDLVGDSHNHMEMTRKTPMEENISEDED